MVPNRKKRNPQVGTVSDISIIAYTRTRSALERASGRAAMRRMLLTNRVTRRNRKMAAGEEGLNPISA